MATPHVSGAAALCIASGACASLTPAGVIAKLRSDAAAQPASFGLPGRPPVAVRRPLLRVSADSGRLFKTVAATGKAARTG